MERHELTAQFAFFRALERLERSMERCGKNQRFAFQGRGTLGRGVLWLSREASKWHQNRAPWSRLLPLPA
jgi:hypothetical protein